MAQAMQYVRSILDILTRYEPETLEGAVAGPMMPAASATTQL